MQELKENLEIVAGYASDNAAKAQERYSHYYNLRARDKHFAVGDRVIVLTPDYNFSRTYARWIGPAVIAEVKSPYSYLVDMPGGSRRHYHANKLRPYIARVSNICVINDSDCEFGDLSTAPIDADKRRPGFCDVVYHEINLKPDFTPKQSKAYRIPEILKPEVERQIDQLVKDGFLVPSKSPMSSPILCVIKNNKEVRLVCDF